MEDNITSCVVLLQKQTGYIVFETVFMLFAGHLGIQLSCLGTGIQQDIRYRFVIKLCSNLASRHFTYSLTCIGWMSFLNLIFVLVFLQIVSLYIFASIFNCHNYSLRPQLLSNCSFYIWWWMFLFGMQNCFSQ